MLGRRLKQLEVRALQTEAAKPEQHTLCFVDVDMRVASKYEMGTGKWTHFAEDERLLWSANGKDSK